MSSDVEYSFKIRLSEVAAKFNSAIPEGVLAAGSTPFFRCDFDGKLLQSENCNLPGDPVWQFRQSFEYRLLEPGIDALVASLAGRTANFEVFVSDGSRQALVGTCAVDLLSVATGASKFQLKLTPAFAPTGSAHQVHSQFMSSSNAYLSFNMTMEQQSVIHLSLQQMTFASLPNPTATKLHYLILEGGTAIETSVLAPTSTPYFETLPPVQCRTSMKALLSTSVRITLIDAMRGDSPIGTLDLPISELLLSADEIGTATGTFKKNLYSSKEYFQNFTALVTGCLLIERLPAFAQLASGQNVDGEISGKPLLPSCFLPPRYVKRPSRLPDFQHGPRALAIPNNNNNSSAGSGYNLVRNNNTSGGGGGGGSARNQDTSYIPAQVSSMPALSSPQRRMYDPTGPNNNNSSTSFDPNRSGYQRNAYDANALPGSGNPPFKSPHRNPNNNTSRSSSKNNRSHSRNTNGSTRRDMMNNSHHSVANIPKSPVAGATRELIQGQDEANFVLESQQRKLAETRAELTHRIAEETAASQARLDELANEEHIIKEKLASLGGHISHLHQQIEAVEEGYANTVDAQSSPTSGYSSPAAKRREIHQLEKELADLQVIGMDLDSLANNLRTHVVMDDSIRRNALELVEKSREQLFRDNQALAAVENKIVSGANSANSTGRDNSYRAISPSRYRNIPKLAVNSNSSANNSPSMTRAASSGRQQARAEAVTTSPRRGGDAAASSSNTNNNNNFNNSSILNNSDIRKSANELNRQLSPRGATTDSGSSPGGRTDPSIQALNSAIVNADVVGIRNIIREHPRALHPRCLLLACTQRKPDPLVIETILEMRPQIMQMTDASTGRSALHCACAADVPQAEAVRVLLDNGASIDEYDAEGLSPFHVALLNCGDFGNIMRYALIDYGASVTQPTQGGCTPALLCASSDSHIEALMFLKQAGADLNAAAPDQRRLPSHRAPPARAITPLEKAEMCGAVATRRFLGRSGTMA